MRLESQSNKITDSLDSEADRANHWRRINASHQMSVSSRDGGVTLTLTDYSAYEGQYGYSDRLNIYMGVGGAGRIIRHSEGQTLDAVLQPGRVGFAVPGTAGEGLWDKLCLLALGAELSKLPVKGGDAPRPDAFVPTASQLYDDPLLTAVLTAMWREAEAHGLISAFFEHGMLIVANRLLAMKPAEISNIRPLPQPQLARVIDRMEQAIADDLTVAELARMVGMSRHHFSRAFKAATGYPPYEYLTRRRVERAKAFLSDDGASVMQVALMVGFANPSQFAAAFRRVTGFSPTAWRRAH